METEKAKVAEKVLELNALSELKEEEIQNLKNVWQNKITEFLEEVSLIAALIKKRLFLLF